MPTGRIRGGGRGVRVRSSTRHYPLHVSGTLDPGLSRWLWLVKWLLAIPHFIVLFFLWIAFVVLTVVAFFAILFTGRYPRGDLRLQRRRDALDLAGAYYAYSALGTDRYPPFTLAASPTTRRTLDVDYPERLSRGLVLVKWWLLAIPHYLIVAFFVGGGSCDAVAATDDRPVGAAAA